MTSHDHETWKHWLSNRQFGGDTELQRLFLERYLEPMGEKILARARLDPGERLLDVGCGMGLLGLTALRAIDDITVLFSDSSADVLACARQAALTTDKTGQCEFLCSEASRIPLTDGTMDAVVSRAVLIYVEDRARALKEYHRVLRHGGRISLCEPVMQFACTEPRHVFWGYDVSPVTDLAEKLRRTYRHAQPRWITEFDEGQLLACTESLDFREIHVEMRMDIAPILRGIKWNTLIRIAWTPMLPSLEEAMNQSLTMDERAAFTDCLRPMVESNQGAQRWAAAYLWATK